MGGEKGKVKDKTSGNERRKGGKKDKGGNRRVMDR